MTVVWVVVSVLVTIVVAIIAFLVRAIFAVGTRESNGRTGNGGTPVHRPTFGRRAVGAIRLSDRPMLTPTRC